MNESKENIGPVRRVISVVGPEVGGAVTALTLPKAIDYVLHQEAQREIIQARSWHHNAPPGAVHYLHTPPIHYGVGLTLGLAVIGATVANSLRPNGILPRTLRSVLDWLRDRYI